MTSRKIPKIHRLRQVRTTLFRLSTREPSPVCLKFVKFAHFSFVVRRRRQPILVLRIKIALNFMHLRSKSFKTDNFRLRQVKFRREYFRIFKGFYKVLAKIGILKPYGLGSRVLKKVSYLLYNICPKKSSKLMGDNDLNKEF